ncbi:high mobility group [Teratosphaeria destructans]|uniref:High mobility group n=1 Tax=Teratosphaeria destructans TaxID=418781 RepID=A0A9W7W284_9PEZI|nr:high mobility group [Teratosphaeria destructans]
MIARRVAVVFRNARLSRPATTFHHDLPLHPLVAQPHRFYATPGRPKSVVGEPSRPVKRSVKKAAIKATASGSPAKDKVESKKKKATAKKPAGKKKPAKKEPTEEQLARRAAKAERKAAKTKTEELRALKKLALKPPPVIKTNAWVVFMAEKMKEKLKGHKGDVKDKLAQNVRDISAQFKAMSPAQIEHYNHLAHTSKEESQAAFKKWVESHTPDEIAEANRARKALRRKTEAQRKKGHKSPWTEIEDDRTVKAPISAFTAFTVNRHKSPDFNNISFVDRSKLVAQEWKALSQEEKNKYQRLRDQDMKRYIDEYSSTYGHPPSSLRQPQAAAASAA